MPAPPVVSQEGRSNTTDPLEGLEAARLPHTDVLRARGGGVLRVLANMPLIRKSCAGHLRSDKGADRGLGRRIPLFSSGKITDTMAAV